MKIIQSTIHSKLSAIMVLCAMSAVITGCDGSYKHSAAGLSPAAGVGPISQWKATGTISNPSKAIDGNLSTAAVVTPEMIEPFIQFDLGGLSHFNMVVIEHGPDTWGFAKNVAVLVSIDGVEFTKVYQTIGTRGRTCILLLKSELARHIRLVPVIAPGKSWSVGEVVVQ